MLSENKKEIIRKIEINTGLQFRENLVEGNLCFAQNNSDLREDFKSGFSLEEFQFFLASFSGKEVEIPEDSENFWKRVEKGRTI